MLARGLSQAQPRATTQSPPGCPTHTPAGVCDFSALSPQRNLVPTCPPQNQELTTESGRQKPQRENQERQTKKRRQNAARTKVSSHAVRITEKRWKGGLGRKNESSKDEGGRVQAPTQHEEAEESERMLHRSKNGHNPQDRRRHSQQRVVERPGKKQQRMANWNELKE